MDGMKIDMGRGKIIPNDGSAEFEVKYKAIVWRPFRGEVVDGIVSNVQALGIFVDVGPLNVFISHRVSLILIIRLYHFFCLIANCFITVTSI